MGVLSGCEPRDDVLKGVLDDAIFAANFGDLISGRAPKVYADPATFFQNTHPAAALCKVTQAVFSRLADVKETGATIRLSTGFGGGKTHSLMALWHLAKNIGDHAMGTDLLPAAGRPKSVTVVAVDAYGAGVPEFASHGKVTVHSLWGEIFYQLDPKNGLKALGDADHPEASPSEAQLERILPTGPLLFLLDELVIYMAKLSPRGQGNLLGFLNLLSSIASKRKQTVVVVTDPGSQAAYAAESAELAKTVAPVATKLDDVVGRKATDYDPIGEETAKVIARRLFKTIKPAAAQAASAAYHSLYQRVAADSPGLIPSEANSPKYAKQIVECYPFHPRLIKTASDRLQALQALQRSRGVLRLFARIIRGVWRSKQDVDVITACEIDWTDSEIQSDLLHRLDRVEFKAAIDADVKSHADELDGPKPGVHRRVASAVLLESIDLKPSSGLEPDDLTLAVLRPDEAGPEPSEAVDRLMGVCWHTYPTSTGKGCVFRYEPNVLKQIEQRRALVPLEDARKRVEAEAQGYFTGPTFYPYNWPTSPKQVPDSAKLQLALCNNEKIAKAVCAYSDDSDPAAPMPRGFINAILAVTATPSSLGAAVERAQRLLAALEIEKENKGESGKLVREQVKRILPDLTRQFQVQTRRAFDVVILPGGVVRHLDEKYQVGDEQILTKPHGQGVLRKFLDQNNLIYQPGDALDTPRFLKEVLPGTTPAEPDVYTAKAVHERFLSAQKLRLIPDGGIVRQTLLKTLADGKIVIRLPDGRAYDATGCVEGPAGRRKRTGDTLPTVSLDDNVLVTTANSARATEWLAEDKPQTAGGAGGTGTGGGGFVPPPPPPGKVTANTWDKIIELSDDRPLLELRLLCGTPADTAAVQQLLPPVGANAVAVDVTVQGTLKDGTGDMNFAANNVKPTHPAKPLTIAQTIFNSVTDVGSSFEVVIKLTFGDAGRAGMRDTLQTLQDSAPESVGVQAVLDRLREVAKK
jgi:hypothetical protein